MAESLTRRELIQAAVVAAAGRALGRVATEGYNVLFLMSDEHSPRAAGFLGNKLIKTPALDSLAQSGAAFTAAYCQNPVCVPSRASFVTGRMPSNVGVFGNDGGLRPDVTTLADVFKKAGYRAVWMGKTHWGGDTRFDSFRRKAADEELDRRRAGFKRAS